MRSWDLIRILRGRSMWAVFKKLICDLRFKRLIFDTVWPKVHAHCGLSDEILLNGHIEISFLILIYACCCCFSKFGLIKIYHNFSSIPFSMSYKIFFRGREVCPLNSNWLYFFSFYSSSLKDSREHLSKVEGKHVKLS